MVGAGRYMRKSGKKTGKESQHIVQFDMNKAEDKFFL